MRRTLVTGMSLWLLAGWSAAQSPGAADRPPQVGEQFPTLAFPSLDDDELRSIADFRGRKVLLIQFASW